MGSGCRADTGGADSPSVQGLSAETQPPGQTTGLGEVSRWSPFLSPGLPSHPTASDLAQGMEGHASKTHWGPGRAGRRPMERGTSRARTRPPASGLLERPSLLLQGPNAMSIRSRQSDVPGLRSVSVLREQVLLLP